MKKIKVDKVILYYMDRVDPDGNLYRFYVYKDMASEIEYFCTEETGNMTIPIGEGKYIEIVPREIVKIPVRGYRKLTGIWNRETCNGKGWYRLFNYFNMLFNLGIVNRWKRESEELIAELEKMCGKKWVNPYKPEEERFVLTLTDEERSLIEERIKAGYYSSENIEKRRVEAHKAKMAAKRAEICERYDKKIRQAEAEKKIILCVFDYGLPINNVIYYPHTNTLSFNWNDYGGKITQEEFDDFVNKVDRSQLPEDIRFELK